MGNDKAQQATETLRAQQQAGTHNPASECSCGTWRTPGVAHAPGDTGAEANPTIVRTCHG